MTEQTPLVTSQESQLTTKYSSTSIFPNSRGKKAFLGALGLATSLLAIQQSGIGRFGGHGGDLDCSTPPPPSESTCPDWRDQIPVSEVRILPSLIDCPGSSSQGYIEKWVKMGFFEHFRVCVENGTTCNMRDVSCPCHRNRLSRLKGDSADGSYPHLSSASSIAKVMDLHLPQ
ncbi:hypothetical protein BD324DRAFT_622655 [Kockovaella imperatae]|uniref:Uncharacterized protein n=1 Tax=Kockovaella imperatae TaxID=4999 RepID=A0A1Y1UI00_9TREE|nr:hypothetical protein BD324DRAFT_622655 [Kockovaella imperatae]ORX37619.1 hypothetical protein BD324DRAFT_622655 [Kockovaella imperatae]